MKRAIRVNLRRNRNLFLTVCLLIGIWMCLYGNNFQKKDLSNISIDFPMRFAKKPTEKAITLNKKHNTDHESLMGTRILKEKQRINSSDKGKPHIQCNSCNYVLVVGYFRGGSTMTLDVLSQARNSFYAFEPINFLSFNTYEKRYIRFLDGTSRLLDEENDLPMAQAEMLFNWFNCKFEDINIGDLTSSNLLFHSRVTSPYYQCQKTKGVKECLDRLRSACRPRSQRILKVVRLRVKTLKYLFDMLPGLKVIYLIRDPRGILHSLIKTGLIPEKDLEQKSETLCQEHMTVDIQSAIKLKEEYKNSIYPVKYETIVNNPLTVFSHMYNFTNLPYTASVKLYIRSHLLGHSSKGQGHFRTKAGNATLIANDWRRTISHKQLDVINRACANVYSMLGYITTDVWSMRNISVSLETRPEKIELFEMQDVFN